MTYTMVQFIQFQGMTYTMVQFLQFQGMTYTMVQFIQGGYLWRMQQTPMLVSV